MMFLWLAAAFAHGGPPYTDTIQKDAQENWVLATSHGYLFEDQGWDWVCEELIGEALRVAFVHTGERAVIATTQGVYTSADGCLWTETPTLVGQFLGQLEPGPTEGELWASTFRGLWQSTDHGQSFTFVRTPLEGASVRSFTRTAGGTFYVLGLWEGEPMVWVSTEDGWASATFDAPGMQLLALGTDEQQRAYAHLPESSGVDRLMRFDLTGQVEELVQVEAKILAFDVTPEAMFISLAGLGTMVSLDDGATWSTPAPPALSCLETRGDRRLGCPANATGVALAEVSASELDPAEWTWTPLFLFEDVSGRRCALEQEPAACDPIWPIVELEMGLPTAWDSPADTDTPSVTEPCGCAPASPPANSLFPCLVAAIVLRRRRTRWRTNTQ